jgi:hypothetical protein
VTGCNDNDCFTWDRFATPQLVVPPSSDQSGTLAAEGTPEQLIYGIEGQVAFVRAVANSGVVVLEQTFEWPHAEHQLPVGTYQVTVYLRTCDGNCGNLDEPTLSCTADIFVEPGDIASIEYALDIDNMGSTSSSSCPITYEEG